MSSLQGWPCSYTTLKIFPTWVKRGLRQRDVCPITSTACHRNTRRNYTVFVFIMPQLQEEMMFDTHWLDINRQYFMSCWTFNLKIDWTIYLWGDEHHIIIPPSSPTHSLPRHSCTDAIKSCSHPYTAALLRIEKKMESTQISTTTRKAIIADRFQYRVNIMNQGI